MDDVTAGDPLPAEARAANLELWNAWTRIHEGSAFYNVEGFKAGATALLPIELEELGPSVGPGVSLLHLQCHFGLDTLNWARLGADVVGLDLSDESIATARRLATELGVAERAEFVCANVYDADAHLDERRFDIVFTSWGAIEWLPDLDRWAAIIARHLRPGGTFYMAEIHPFARCMDDDLHEGALRVGYRYFPAPDRPDVDAVHGTYADREADTEGLVAYGWSHSVSEILDALIGAGLRLDHLHEFPAAPAPLFPGMVEGEDRLWRLTDDEGRVTDGFPLSFSLKMAYA